MFAGKIESTPPDGPTIVRSIQFRGTKFTWQYNYYWNERSRVCLSIDSKSWRVEASTRDKLVRQWKLHAFVGTRATNRASSSALCVQQNNSDVEVEVHSDSLQLCLFSLDVMFFSWLIACILDFHLFSVRLLLPSYRIVEERRSTDFINITLIDLFAFTSDCRRLLFFFHFYREKIFFATKTMLARRRTMCDWWIHGCLWLLLVIWYSLLS